MQNKSTRNCATPSHCYSNPCWHLRRTKICLVSSEEDCKFIIAFNPTSSHPNFKVGFKYLLNVDAVFVFRECWNILNQRDWESSPHKIHFESGVRLGVGSFNLVISFGLLISITSINYLSIELVLVSLQFVSLLPQKVLKLLEFIGFNGTWVRYLHTWVSLHERKSFVFVLESAWFIADDLKSSRVRRIVGQLQSIWWFSDCFVLLIGSRSERVVERLRVGQHSPSAMCISSSWISSSNFVRSGPYRRGSSPSQCHPRRSVESKHSSSDSPNLILSGSLVHLLSVFGDFFPRKRIPTACNGFF